MFIDLLIVFSLIACKKSSSDNTDPNKRYLLSKVYFNEKYTGLIHMMMSSGLYDRTPSDEGKLVHPLKEELPDIEKLDQHYSPPSHQKY